MVDWKIYIESPQKRALDFCYGSLTEHNGWGCGLGYYGKDLGEGFGDGIIGDAEGEGYCGGEDSDGNGDGDGSGDDGDGRGNGRSATVW